MTEFFESAIRRMRYYKELGDKTFAQLQDEDFYYQPNEESNSIEIIIRHMHGNMMSRWTNFLTEDGEKKWRERDNEFVGKRSSREELMRYWEEGWACFLDALQALTPGDLLKTVTIRGEALTVVDAIHRQMAHYPYHVGQVIYIAKILKDNDWKSLSLPKRR
jgi:hypothetical protein